MNTTKYIPFDCIAPNIIALREQKEFSGAFGTGFFCVFPPYDYVFYITARHCVVSLFSENSDASLQIPIKNNCNKAVSFCCGLETNINNCPTEEREDIVVFVVDRNMDTADYNTLIKRSLRLLHQDEIDRILELGAVRGERLRAVGFPTHDHPNCKTEIDYVKQEGRFQPRGFHGVLLNDGRFPNQYVIQNTNWTEGEYRGFSGSPVIALAPLLEKPDQIVPIPVGIILMASGNVARFLSINVATNLIATFLKEQIADGIIEEIPEY